MKMKNFALMVSFSIAITNFFHSGQCQKNTMDLDGLRDMLKPMSKSCKSKTGVPDELVAATHNGEFPEERKLMCYFKCLAVTLKLMNKKGEMQPTGINKQIDTLMKVELIPKMKELLQICFNSVPVVDDPCTYAFRLVVCAYNEDKSMYFLP